MIAEHNKIAKEVVTEEQNGYQCYNELTDQQKY